MKKKKKMKTNVCKILERRPPYADMELIHVAVRVHKGYRPRIPENCPKNFGLLISQCWHQDPQQRPEFETIYEALETMENGLT
jgi:hypothetical protein